MTFDTPTTKNEMYEILQEIFYYYRIRREADTGVTLNDLELDRMTYTPMSDAEITTKAQTALQSAQAEKVLNYKKKISDEIAELTAKVATYGTQKTAAENAARSSYAAATSKAEREATKRGIASSSAVIDRIADLQTALAAEITAIDADYDEKIATTQARITRLQTDLAGADTYYSQVFSYEVLAEKDKIKDDEEKLQREIFKYNNGLDEKEQRAANSIISTTRSLELRYMNISSSFFTKDQLVEMGYYEDAINCVCAYFDTLSAATAYQQIAHDTKVAIYLDDYYANVVYMYKTLANA